MLSQQDIDDYNSKGFLLKIGYTPTSLIREIINELKELEKNNFKDFQGIVYEKDQKIIRGLQGVHLYNQFFSQLMRNERYISPAKQILNAEIYLHQYKINYKKAFKGDIWPWHQDFPYWHVLDNIPLPKLINIIIFIDEVNEFNAPLFLIPQSHNHDHTFNSNGAFSYFNNNNQDWQKSFGVGLQYVVKDEIVSKNAMKYGVSSAKGPAGTTLFFHSQIIHASSSNISPFDRRYIILTYNAIENRPIKIGNRPEFLAGRDFTSL